MRGTETEPRKEEAEPVREMTGRGDRGGVAATLAGGVVPTTEPRELPTTEPRGDACVFCSRNAETGTHDAPRFTMAFSVPDRPSFFMMTTISWPCTLYLPLDTFSNPPSSPSASKTSHLKSWSNLASVAASASARELGPPVRLMRLVAANADRAADPGSWLAGGLVGKLESDKEPLRDAMAVSRAGDAFGDNQSLTRGDDSSSQESNANGGPPELLNGVA